MTILWILIIGGLAGYSAGFLMKGRGFGLLSNILIGIAGSFIGGYLLGLAGLSLGGGLVGVLTTAVIGAVVLLAIAQTLKKV